MKTMKPMKTNRTNSQQITFDSTFEGLDVYSGTKAIHGLNLSMLQSCKALLDHALCSMKRPIGFHVVIEDPAKASKRIPEIIQRWSSQFKQAEQAGSSDPLIAWCREVRPRTKETHMHLHVMFDSYGSEFKTRDQISSLIVSLQKKSVGSRVKLQYRDPKSLPVFVDSDTGELKRTGSTMYHDIRREYRDYFLRLSYICKIHTKCHNLKNWSCSNLTNRAQHTARVQRATDQTQQLLGSLARISSFNALNALNALNAFNSLNAFNTNFYRSISLKKPLPALQKMNSTIFI